MDVSTIEELARQKRNDYARDWRSKNKDKVSEANRRYWLNRAKKELAAQQQEADHAEC